MDDPNVTDWISASFVVSATIIALITLFTVYISALQILSQRRRYRHGLSDFALGPWKSKVVSSSLFGLHNRLQTPAISLPRLIDQKWEPQFTFPAGFLMQESAESAADIEKDPQSFALAKTSWVTFLQAIGITPDKEALFDMQYESEMINGTVPVRWRGSDLSIFCSMLGFQSNEPEPPQYKLPMPLPTQWSGPLGVLQFRSGFEGCVVEFRRRTKLNNQLSLKFHSHYTKRILPPDESLPLLFHQLCNSVGGMGVDTDGKRRLLYLGYADYNHILEVLEGLKREEETDEKEQEAQEIDGISKGSSQTMVDVFQELEATNMSDDDILEKVWGLPPKTKKKPANDPKKSEVRSELVDDIEEQRKKKERKKRALKEVLIPCPGLLSVIVSGDLAASRELDIANAYEYHRRLVPFAKINRETYPFNLGDLYMGRDTLELMKNALSHIKARAFFFSPTSVLAGDLMDVYEHVREEYLQAARVFTTADEAHWNGWNELWNGAELINEMQRLWKSIQREFSVEDVAVVSQASITVRRLIKPENADLGWALLVCPKLFRRLAKFLSKAEGSDLQIFLNTTIEIEKENVNGAGFESNLRLGDAKEEDATYAVPLCRDGTFTAVELTAAFMDLWLTFYWIEMKWTTNVHIYGGSIPPTILMF